MKKGIIMLIAMTSALLCFAAGNDISKLWKDYEAARKADRPKQQLEILEKIGAAAEKGRLTWDYYRYWTEKISVSTSRNWKLRDSLNTEYQKAVIKYNEPFLTYYTGIGVSGDRVDYVLANEQAFRDGHHSEFYGSLSKEAKKCVSNDFEYVVWTNAYNHNDLYIKTLLERFSKPVVDMYNEQSDLNDEFSKLQRNNSTEAEYRALYDKCKDFNKRKSAFKGQDALLAACWSVDGITDELTSTSVYCNAEKDTVTVTVRNLSDVDLVLARDGKTIHKTNLKNPRKSFYVQDTIRYILPVIDDGEYDLTCRKGKTEHETNYEKYTVSLAHRHDAGGHAIYAADYITGKPLSNLTVYLYDDSKYSQAVSKKEGFSTPDFKYLPETMQKKISAKVKEYTSYSIACGYTDANGVKHLSKRVSVCDSGIDDKGFDRRGLIFLDRSLVKPGDSISFKVLVYSSDKDYQGGVVTDDQVKVKLYDSEGKEVKTLKLKTGEFGTASGTFSIPTGKRNGMWSLSASDGHISVSESFRVDDVVLPTFELTFDPQEKTALPGEMIPVKGTIKGYSGHNPSSADISYSVIEMGREIASGTLKADADGRFAFEFPASVENYSSHYYNVQVKVADATGETLEFSTSRQSSSYISFNLRFVNEAEGSLRFSGEGFGNAGILTEKEALIATSSRYGALDMEYVLKCGEKSILEGRCKAGDTIRLDFSKLPQEHYVLEAKAKIADRSELRDYSTKLSILKLNPDDKALNTEVRHLFLPVEGDVPAFRIGASEGPLWACAALYGPGNKLLATRSIYLEGKKGTEKTLQDISFPLASYPEEMTMYIFYFKDGMHCNWSHRYTRPAGNFDMPLEFTRFHENAFPASNYTFTVKGLPASEAVAAVFDKAIERFRPLRYTTPYLPAPAAPWIAFSMEDGNVGTGWGHYPLRKYKTRGVYTLGAASRVVEVVEEEAIPFALMDNSINMEATSFKEVDEAEAGLGADIPIRSDFRTVIAFKPHILSDAYGNFNFDVTTSDKVSTYIVQFFAHDKKMRNGLLRKEMVVSVPVEVSIVEPRFLFSGDRYCIKSKLSSAMDDDVTGKVRIDLYDGDDYKKSPVIKSVMSAPVTVKKGEVKDFEYEVDVPEGISALGLKLTFIADAAADGTERGSDAVFVTIPVYSASQLITEAHSSILLAGADRGKLIAELRALFTNGPGSEAEVKEISIRDMLYEALPSHIDTNARDAVSLSAALMVVEKVEKLNPEANFAVEKALLRSRLDECLNSDGGFGWLPGMRSSAIITAVVLERMAETATAASYYDAARYLDRAFLQRFTEKYWWCGVSLEQYLYVRSLYPGVPYISEGFPEKALKQFKKDAKAFLTPGSDRGLQGRILSKTRRALTLERLASTPEGTELAKQWGIRFGTASKLTSSLEKDKASLREYAVEHRSGGAYYPNAVMPWRASG